MLLIIGGDTTEEDVGFQDDNVSHVGSDYSEFHATEQDNPFAQPIHPIMSMAVVVVKCLIRKLI
ncbi:hypothetical protein DOY81_009563 [Sarcophaga bullata]|nr:hypothetical protein DOY81_009563 [Sarcophaga bullata]